MGERKREWSTRLGVNLGGIYAAATLLRDGRSRTGGGDEREGEPNELALSLHEEWRWRVRAQQSTLRVIIDHSPRQFAGEILATHRTRSALIGATILVFAAILSFRGAGALPVNHPSPRNAERPKVLADSAERTLALEALPPSMRAGAGVWVLTRNGSREAKRTSNGYTCIVNRDEVLAIKPTCFDEEGTASILPVNAYFADRMMQGIDVPTIKREISDRFARGIFRSPRRAGIAFMLSPRIVNVIDPVKRTLGTAPPHYMIYAPNVSNQQLRIPAEAYAAQPWLPYVAYTGPHGFLIVSIPDSAVVASGHVHGK